MSHTHVKVPEDAPMWRSEAVGVGVTLERVAAYLPNNFRAHEVSSLDGVTNVVVTGTDVAGWTLRDYVEPRLASGLIFLQNTVQEGRTS